jgi:hypothetical protein
LINLKYLILIKYWILPWNENVHPLQCISVSKSVDSIQVDSLMIIQVLLLTSDGPSIICRITSLWWRCCQAGWANLLTQRRATGSSASSSDGAEGGDSVTHWGISHWTAPTELKADSHIGMTDPGQSARGSRLTTLPRPLCEGFHWVLGFAAVLTLSGDICCWVQGLTSFSTSESTFLGECSLGLRDTQTESTVQSILRLKKPCL